MNDNLKDELKALAQDILNSDLKDVSQELAKIRELYEKLLIANYLKDTEQSLTESEIVEDPPVLVNQPKPWEFSDKAKAELGLEEPIIIKEDPVEENKAEPVEEKEIFIPTFEEVKEDFSLKEEFKDAVSLDDTEEMFTTKKETTRQLSLNDKLLRNSIQVGLNDRIAFVNKLFNFSQSEFNKELTVLNGFTTEQEAVDYINIQLRAKYRWEDKEEIVERFVSLVERRFMS